MIDGTVLAYIPSPSQGVWHLGPVPIRAYALCIIVGIVVAVWWGSRRWQARGGQPGEVIDVALWAVPFGLVGGRLYHVFTDWQTYFGPGGKGLGAALRVWDGGLGIWGAVALGAVGAWIGARNMGIKLPPFGDAIAPAILLAQAIGRLGNYFNQELFGRTTDVPWGLEIFLRSDGVHEPSYKLIDGTSTGDLFAVVHPTFLYEMIWNLVIVLVLVLIDRRFQIGHGRLFALYVAGYCAGRFGVELMRDDFATHIFGVRINVFTSAIILLCAALYVVMAPKGREKGLTMYWPDRAEELAEEGAVGYVPPALADSELVDDERPVATEALPDDAEFNAADDAVVADALDDEEPEAEVPEAEVPAAATAAVADAADESDSTAETDDAEVLDDDTALLDDTEQPADTALLDDDTEQPTDDTAQPVEDSEPIVEDADDTAEAAEPADAGDTADATDADATATATDVEDTATGAGDTDTDADTTETTEEEPVSEEPAPRVIPGREPSIVDSVSSQGYTVVRADDDELAGISIIEQNPGGSAGSIEIRHAGSAETTPADTSDESRPTEVTDEGDTPEEDR